MSRFIILKGHLQDINTFDFSNLPEEKIRAASRDAIAAIEQLESENVDLKSQLLKLNQEEAAALKDVTERWQTAKSDAVELANALKIERNDLLIDIRTFGRGIIQDHRVNRINAALAKNGAAYLQK